MKACGCTVLGSLAHAYQGCLVAGGRALRFWFAFYVWNIFDREMHPACWHIPWIHFKKKKRHSVRSHLPVSSRDMNLKQLSYLGSQWKLSSSQMKDVPPSWVPRMKWLWCDVTLSTLACGNSSGNTAHSALPTAGKSVILDWECLGKELMQTNQTVSLA